MPPKARSTAINPQHGIHRFVTQLISVVSWGHAIPALQVVMGLAVAHVAEHAVKIPVCLVLLLATPTVHGMCCVKLARVIQSIAANMNN